MVIWVRFFRIAKGVTAEGGRSTLLTALSLSKGCTTPGHGKLGSFFQIVIRALIPLPAVALPPVRDLLAKKQM
jgi:hypothetical protein